MMRLHTLTALSQAAPMRRARSRRFVSVKCLAKHAGLLVLASLWCCMHATVSQAAPAAALPGLQQVPPSVAPRGLVAGAQKQPPAPQQQPDCPVPTITRDSFSASQVAYLVGELQQVITPGCYSVVSTSLAVCLPDLSLSSGCCTPGCARSLRLAVAPECLAQFWRYVCSNGTYYASYVAGVVERCLPIAASGLELTCPINETTMSKLLSLGTEPGGLEATIGLGDASPAAGINISAGVLPVRADQRDVLYYAGCAQETPRMWPDFNGSLLFDSLLAFARDVPQDCLRTSLAYLPSCYDDLTYQTGCCSLRCRAALEKVPVPCLDTFLRSLCIRIPSLTKYFFNAAARCANRTLSCQGMIAGIDSGVSSPRSLPLVASSTGQCPLSEVAWPGYNTLNGISQTLRLVADSSEACRPQISKLSSSCFQELGIQLGCCSYQCALTLRSVPDNCHNEFRKMLCREPEVAKFSIALADRCLGSGFYECGQPQQQPDPQQGMLVRAASGSGSGG